eukprot:g16324.t2
MSPVKRLTHLALLAAAVTTIAAATSVPRDVHRRLQIAEAEFLVTGFSGEEYVVEFADENGTDAEIVVITESEHVPVETTVTVVGESITTIVIGTLTYSISYDSSGEVGDVTLVPEGIGTRRTQRVDLADRRLQSCKQFCAASANQLCGALIFGCNDPTGALAALLGPLCEDVDDLCNVVGILVGCQESCGSAPGPTPGPSPAPTPGPTPSPQPITPVNPCLDLTSSANRCSVRSSGFMDLSCGITDEDAEAGHLGACIDAAGRQNIVLLQLGSNDLTSLPSGVFDSLTELQFLNLSNNGLTSLPSGVFDSLTALKSLLLNDNDLMSIPSGVFDSLTALEFLEMSSTDLTTLPSGIFDSLTALEHLILYNNDLTSLPSGVFDSLTALEWL